MSAKTQDMTTLRDFSSLCTFLLIALFSVLSLLLVVLGAQGYRKASDSAARNGEARVSAGYVAGKLRAQDGDANVRVDSANGLDVLVLSAGEGEDAYETRIYCDGSALMEQFTSADAPFDPELGEYLTDAEAFTASIDGQLLTYRVTLPGGAEETHYAALRAEREGHQP